MPSAEHPETKHLAPKQRLDIGSSYEAGPFFSLWHSTQSASAISRNNWFLKRLNAHLEKHLSDGSLTVGCLLRIIGMSRTCLHRKLDALTGMSTTEYIRYFRLRRAVELMEEHPEQNMFEIAISVGFNNQSYFTKKFKEVFGCCPREYRDLKPEGASCETYVLNMEHTS